MVLAVTGAQGCREGAGVIAAVCTDDVAPAAAETGLRRPGRALRVLLAGDDVNDARGAVGLELRRRSREHLDAFDVPGGNRLQVIPVAGTSGLSRRVSVPQ